MKQFLIYTKLQVKRVLRVYPAMVLMTFLLSLSLGALLTMQASRGSASGGQGEEGDETAIGIVGSDSSPYLKLGLTMLQNMDSAQTGVRMETLEKKEALKKLRKGTLSAVVEIPAGTTDKLLSGDLTSQMTLVLPDGSSALGPLLIRELSACISSMIGQMESASFTLADLSSLAGQDSPEGISAAQTDLLKTSLKKILSRGTLFRLSRIKTKTSLTIESYYLCACLLLLLLMAGVMCAVTYIRSDRSVQVLLKIRGFSEGRQVLAEYLSLLTLFLLLAAVFLPLAGFGLSKGRVSFAELWSGTGRFPSAFAHFCLGAFPVLVMTAALDLCLYELADSLISGVLLQFLAMILLAYLSGVFYPVSSLPDWVARLAPFLPTGQAMLYLRKSLIQGAGTGSSMALLLLFTGIFLFLAALLRRRSLQRTGRS